MSVENTHECDKCRKSERIHTQIQCFCDSCLEDREKREYDRGYADGLKESE